MKRVIAKALGSEKVHVGDKRDPRSKYRIEVEKRGDRFHVYVYRRGIPWHRFHDFEYSREAALNDARRWINRRVKPKARYPREVLRGDKL